ncbi:MAG: glucose-1-phosphate adenylyltransferase [Saprospiraceae bacterium]|nr:glucose-1-phosphate adenylyltransferase [Saprospiraceae bacterium]
MKIKLISLILGGGAGTRLFPLTEDRSKPAVPIAGKYRLIDIPISNCLNSGVVRMFVLTQFNSASLNKHIKNTYHFDLFSRGFVDILAAEQTQGNANWFQGTADAVRQTTIHLRNHDFDYVLILAGDQLYQMDFEKMAKYHIAQNAALTIATIPVDAHDAEGFGIMKVNEYGFIERFIEKPNKDVLHDWTSIVSDELRNQGKEYLASMGIYIFSKNALMQLLEDHPTATDFGKEIIPSAIKSGYNVASYEYNGYWTDVGSVSSFYDANLELTDEIPKFNLFDNNQIIYTRPRLLAPAKISGTKITKSIVSEGSIIQAEIIHRSIIGIRARIGSGTQIKSSVIMGNDFFESLEKIVHQPYEIPMGIGNDCLVENAIVDKNCRIGNNVKIRGHASLENIRTDTHCVVDGIVVLRKGAVIPHDTVIGYHEPEE